MDMTFINLSNALLQLPRLLDEGNTVVKIGLQPVQYSFYVMDLREKKQSGQPSKTVDLIPNNCLNIFMTTLLTVRFYRSLTLAHRKQKHSGQLD